MIFLQKNQYPAYFHDSLKMVAQVLSKRFRNSNLTENDVDKISGKELVEFITNSKFEGLDYLHLTYLTAK